MFFWLLFLGATATAIDIDSPEAAKEHTILVSVLSKHGHPLPQPQIDDFQITENKQVVKITRLSPANHLAILFTILIDTSKSVHHEKTNEALQGSLDFLSSVMRKDDRIVIASFSDQF